MSSILVCTNIFLIHVVGFNSQHMFYWLYQHSIFAIFACVQYELLDEMMDFGYPQYTEAKILSEFIKTDAYRMEVNQRPPMAVTNAVSWRSEGIRYKKNEVSSLPLFIITEPSSFISSVETVVHM